MPRSRLDRTRRALGRYALVLGTVGVLAVALGVAWAEDAIARVERTERAIVADRWVEEGRFTYLVPVVRDSPAFPNGTVLPMGEPGYFATVSPRVNLTFAWRLTEPEDTVVRAAGTLTVVLRSDAPDGRAYWTIERSLASALPTNVTGDGLVLGGTLDVATLAAEAENVTRGLGARPGKTRWDVVARVHFTVETPFGDWGNASSFTLPVQYENPLYTLPDEEGSALERPHGRTVLLVEETRAGPRALLAKPLVPATILGGLALLGLVVDARRRRLPDNDGFARDRDRYEEWITPAAGAPIPAGVPIVEVKALRDLVALAAEAQTRVLLDEESRLFTVMTPGATYLYRAHVVHRPAGLARARHA